MNPPTSPTTEKVPVPFLVILLVNIIAAYIPALLWVPGCPGGGKLLLFLFAPVVFVFLLSNGSAFLASLALFLFLLIVTLLSILVWRCSRLINLRILGLIFVSSLLQGVYVAGFIIGMNNLGHS